ncbi:hypothetical protein AGABI1DRAFT_110609 [Agaricus bisporus var. burnettii JB137-S8]|nr:hypothetical protein AGABI2DRAFT_189491 [Agaricus bisporus var. bisporus H97]XP_007325742.1 uncharacterized protein AGABI1DRAFT_110609 [Agaricus bisporus var. burnettii JB137-S8]EKM84007.1 hypothetical protein AGABI1DRAFT_110609 [Agaricus bisporus var. burnettii JB137-S8]EKV51214.1 hypothetical protein AGABI2DRAFT_189491 [Agaricus bisporus var. bisporus H97]
MSSSQLLSLDFETKAPSYMDSMDPSFSYMENGGLEYLQYPPQSPTTFELSVGLPSSSPLAFNNALTLSGEYTYSPSFNTASPERSYTPPEGPSLSPPALSYNLSGGDVVPEVPSGRHSRNSSAGSAAGVSYAATVPRSHRFNPIGVAANRPTLRARRRSSKTSDDGHIEAAGLDAEEEDDEEFQPPPLANSQANNDARRETIRKQRIESEQRRRDELRDGYTRLKENLPTSNQKSSKVSLLDRATSHIRYLETVKEQLEMRLKAAETEVHRLRGLNETLMLNSAQRQIAGPSSLASQF